MSTAPQYLGKAGGVLALKRLVLYRRYADLVASQESALDAEDMALFEELGNEISAIQQEIGPADPEIFARGGEIAREATVVLKESVESVERIRARLAAMRESGAQDVRTATQRRPQARRYLAEGSQSLGGLSKLDVTS